MRYQLCCNVMSRIIEYDRMGSGELLLNIDVAVLDSFNDFDKETKEKLDMYILKEFRKVNDFFAVSLSLLNDEELEEIQSTFFIRVASLWDHELDNDHHIIYCPFVLDDLIDREEAEELIDQMFENIMIMYGLLKSDPEGALIEFDNMLKGEDWDSIYFQEINESVQKQKQKKKKEESIE